ncbi:MAG: PDZ domain-containing protein [Acidimicrobiia bacterium]|nr:PDZ domain-containing protein [Acidimicrobiia bacterium]
MSPADDLEPPTDATEPTEEAAVATPDDAPGAPIDATTETAAIIEPEPTIAPPPPVSGATPARRSGVLVPKWLVVALAGLLVFGLGLGTGLLIGDGDHDGHDSHDRFRSEVGDRSDRAGPGQGQGPRGNRQFPFGGGRGGNTGPGQGGQGSTPTRPTTPNAPSTPNTGTSAFIGIAPENSTNPVGVAIVQLQPAGPAATAGLKVDDVITAIDGSKVDTVATLRSVLADHAPGDVLKVTYSRDGKSATLDVTATDRNATPPQ